MARQTPSGVLVWRAAGLTDTGRKRARNEDAYALDPEHGVLVVADGLGGHKGGDVASHFVATLAPSLLQTGLDARPRATMAAVRALVHDVILEVGRRLRREADDRPELQGLGSTVVLACLRGDRAIVGSMGDSRAYLFRRGRLRLLTEDHSLVAMLVRSGELSAEAARTHAARGMVSRYVGIDGDVFPDVRTVPLAHADRLLLCSDGLSGMLDDGAIGAMLRRSGEPETACRELVDAANAAGGDDNITAIVADCVAAPPRRSRRGGSM